MKQEDIIVPGYEKIVKFTEPLSGLNAIIAVHNTTLGPGLGGTRIYPYPNFDHALTDVLRLSKGMTYKAGMANVGLGGAKSVIIADPKTNKSPALLHAFGEAVNTFGGKYICAEDVGSNIEDIHTILNTTKYACGAGYELGSGDPSIFTAWGIVRGMKSIFKHLENHTSLEDKTIAIQGLGNVGKHLVNLLFWEGAKLIVADVNEKALSGCFHRYEAEVVSPEEILFVDCDILSPCAMGGILNKETIPKLRCQAIAGSANNQLLHPSDADQLNNRGIFYAPDFVINAGGLINVSRELSPEGYQACESRKMTQEIHQNLLEIFQIANKKKISTHLAATEMVDYRLEHCIGKRSVEPVFHFGPDTSRKVS
ncbi:Glu/Leu/Phe/Val family dehydrogenase [Simkania sp.]|uniref:Glu/Leu/Phe/Val family dehydrogenase n=1 Tax=Simkania sp. TaxID=34094 RepID=UPI003B51D301